MLQLNNVFEIYWTPICDFPQGSISAITKQMSLNARFKKFGPSRTDLLSSEALQAGLPRHSSSQIWNAEERALECKAVQMQLNIRSQPGTYEMNKSLLGRTAKH